MEENKLTIWWDKHQKLVFILRFVLWTICAAILPFSFIAWRYKIFTVDSQIKLTGWGFIAIIIVIAFISTLVKYIYKGLKPGLAKQCISGFVSVILPLILLYLLINSIEDSIQLFKQALGCVILCEAIAIPINPFPEWLVKRQAENKEQKVETMSDIFWDSFLKHKKD